MSNQRIIYQNEDGTISILIPAPDCGLTINEIAAKDVPNGAKFAIIDADDIPSDRSFRNAWKLDGSLITESLEQSKLIALDLMRAKRASDFAPLDLQATIPSQVESAEAARQVIRDKYHAIQIAINQSDTPQKIKLHCREFMDI